MDSKVLKFPINHTLDAPKTLSMIELACLQKPWTMYRLAGTTGENQWHMSALLVLEAYDDFFFYVADAPSGLFHLDSGIKCIGLKDDDLEDIYKSATDRILKKLGKHFGEISTEEVANSVW